MSSTPGGWIAGHPARHGSGRRGADVGVCAPPRRPRAGPSAAARVGRQRLDNGLDRSRPRAAAGERPTDCLASSVADRTSPTADAGAPVRLRPDSHRGIATSAQQWKQPRVNTPWSKQLRWGRRNFLASSLPFGPCLLANQVTKYPGRFASGRRLAAVVGPQLSAFGRAQHPLLGPGTPDRKLAECPPCPDPPTQCRQDWPTVHLESTPLSHGCTGRPQRASLHPWIECGSDALRCRPATQFRNWRGFLAARGMNQGTLSPDRFLFKRLRQRAGWFVEV